MQSLKVFDGTFITHRTLLVWCLSYQTWATVLKLNGIFWQLQHIINSQENVFVLFVSDNCVCFACWCFPPCFWKRAFRCRNCWKNFQKIAGCRPCRLHQLYSANSFVFRFVFYSKYSFETTHNLTKFEDWKQPTRELFELLQSTIGHLRRGHLR